MRGQWPKRHWAGKMLKTVVKLGSDLWYKGWTVPPKQRLKKDTWISPCETRPDINTSTDHQVSDNLHLLPSMDASQRAVELITCKLGFRPGHTISVLSKDLVATIIVCCPPVWAVARHFWVYCWCSYYSNKERERERERVKGITIYIYYLDVGF